MSGEPDLGGLPPIARRRGPDASSVDAPFWEALRRDELCLQRCTACGAWMWPPAWRCGGCGSWETHWPRIAMTGRVYAHARSQHAFDPGMRRYLPFTNVLVELPQAGGARLLGLFVGDDAGLATHCEVTGFVQPAADPEELPALRWRLTPAGGSPT